MRGALERAGNGAPVRGRAVPLWPVLLTAALCRLGVFLAFPAVFDFVATGAVHGSAAFDAYARNLVAHGVYGFEPGVADAALPPAYGLALAGAYALLGRSALTVALLNLACDLAAIALLAAIGDALFRRRAVGALAGLGMACYPYLVFQSLAVNDTSLFVLELHALVWIVLRLRESTPAARGAAALAALAGLVAGAGALTRPVLLPVAVALALWLLSVRPQREMLRRLAVLLLAATLPLAVWTMRNAAALGETVVIATNGGSNFWQGNNAETIAYLRAGYDVQWISPGPLGDLDYRDPAADRRFLAAGLRFLREHPERVPALLWTKLVTQWSLDIAPRRNPGPSTEGTPAAPPGISQVTPEGAVLAYSRPLFERVGRTAHRVTWGAALVLAVAGIVAARRRLLALAPVWIVLASMTAYYVVFHTSTRYRAPGDPLLFLLAASGALSLAGAVRRRTARG